jgi:DNA-binding beta-propeller fold protein YncE
MGASGGRPRAALLLFLGLLAAGCRPGGAPGIAQRWRIGLGACGLAVDAEGKRLAVVCRRSNDVWVLSLPDGAFVARMDTLAKPRALLFHPENESFYVAEGLSSVALVSLADQRVERSFRPPWPVGGFAFEPGSRRLFCSQVGMPTLGVYRLKDMHLETSLAVGGEVQATAFAGPDAWVVTRQADALVRISLKEMSVKAMALVGPEPRGLALDLDAGLAYVPCHGRAGAAQALALPSPIPDAEDQDSPLSPGAEAGPQPRDLSGPADDGGDTVDAQEDELDEAVPAADAAAFHLYGGGGVAVVRLKDVRRVDYIDVPGGPLAAVLAPSKRLLAVACEDGMLRLVDLAQRRVEATLDLEGRPGAMLLDPDGHSLLVALSSAKTVELIRPGNAWR